MIDTSSKLRLCSVDDVDRDSAMRVEAGGLTVAVFNIGGTYYVTDDHCTHGPGSLSDGYLDGFEIECDFHNGKFDIRTGEVTAPPCMTPVKTYRVIIENNDVLIEV
jgi:nitrite reductase/ring-hydroxylating ferredoxin subunit